MAAEQTRHARSTWPIVYGHRSRSSRGAGTTIAWILFLVLGIPFILMAALTMLARAGIYVDLFRPLWQPWPPDDLKPFLGLGVFAATLAYLAYRAGHRRGFTAGLGVGLTAIRTSAETRIAATNPTAEPEAPPASVPPPPPPEEAPEQPAQPD